MKRTHILYVRGLRSSTKTAHTKPQRAQLPLHGRRWRRWLWGILSSERVLCRRRRQCHVHESPVLVQVRQRAEHPAADSADRAALVQRPVVSQRVPALESLVADRAAQAGRGDTCRAQQQRVRIAARPGRLPAAGNYPQTVHARTPLLRA